MPQCDNNEKHWFLLQFLFLFLMNVCVSLCLSFVSLHIWVYICIYEYCKCCFYVFFWMTSLEKWEKTSEWSDKHEKSKIFLSNYATPPMVRPTVWCVLPLTGHGKNDLSYFITPVKPLWSTYYTGSFTDQIFPECTVEGCFPINGIGKENILYWSRGGIVEVFNDLA